MKKLLLATCCLALTSTASLAADLSAAYTKAPVMAAPAFSWTGCYLGANVGGGTMTSDFFDGEPGGKGALAGGQGGCNYQDGNWVFGLEGEGYWSNIKINGSSSGIPNLVFPGGGTSITNSSLNNNADFTIAARVGMAFDRTLIYAKGGWAWGDTKFNNSFVDTNAAGVVTSRGSSSVSSTLDGPMIGVGIEHALTRNWTVKFEYDFIAYGTKEVAFSQCNTGDVCGQTGTTGLSTNKQIFKIGANYLFNLGAP